MVNYSRYDLNKMGREQIIQVLSKYTGIPESAYVGMSRRELIRNVVAEQNELQRNYVGMHKRQQPRNMFETF